MAQLFFEDVEVGQEIELRETPSKQQLVVYAAATNDFTEIHYDLAHAQGTGLPGVIIHGALKHALLGRMLYEWTGEVSSVRRLAVQFRGMDFPEQELVCRGVVAGKRYLDGEALVDLQVWTENERGEKTSPGSATVVLPFRASSSADNA